MKVIYNINRRFDVLDVADPGFSTAKGKHLTGISGYHGRFANFIGWILEKIFHLTVRVVDDEKKIYYLNRKSFAKWYCRVSSSQFNKRLAIHLADPRWMPKAINSLVKTTKRKKSLHATLSDQHLRSLSQQLLITSIISPLKNCKISYSKYDAEDMFWYLLPDFGRKVELPLSEAERQRFAYALGAFLKLTSKIKTRVYDSEEDLKSNQLPIKEAGCLFVYNPNGESELCIFSGFIKDFVQAGVKHQREKEIEILTKLAIEMEKGISYFERKA